MVVKVPGDADLRTRSVADFPQAQKFMMVLNGDWSKQTISFYTAGRNITRTQARSLIFSAILDMDLLHAASEEPSMDDWFSTAECAGKVSLGILCHNILEQVVDKSFPSWNTMAMEKADGSADDPSVEGATAARVRVQKKTYRSRACLWTRSRKISIVLLTILGMAVEHLMGRIDFLTERGKALFDLPFIDLNPFCQCQRTLCHMLAQGFKTGAPLRMVMLHFSDGSPESISALQMQVLQMGCDMGSQIWWRFRYLRELPLTLVDAVNPGLPPHVQRAALGKPFVQRGCCHDKDCSEKIASVYGTVSAAFDDSLLKDGLTCVGISFPIVNMRSERELATVRHAQGNRDKRPELEAVIAKALLSMVMREHRRLGGEDPRYVTRKQLLEKEVPLACSKAGLGKTRKRTWTGTFVNWFNPINAERKKAGNKMSQALYSAFRDAHLKQWADMSAEEKNRELLKAREHHSEKIAGSPSVCPDKLPAARSTCLYRNVVSECMSSATPLDAAWFEKIVRDESQIPPEAPMPGISYFGEGFRRKQLQEAFIKDENAIPKDQVFTYTMPCCLAHPRLCATEHQNIMPAVKKACKELHNRLAAMPGGSCFLIWHNDKSPRCFMQAHFRFANPRVGLLMHARLDEDGSYVEAEIDEHTCEFRWDMAISVVGDFFRAERSVDLYVWLAPLRRDNRVCFGSCHKYAIDVQHMIAQLESPTPIYPAPPRATPSAAAPSADAKFMEAGLRSLPQEGKMLKKEKTTPPKAVKVCMPVAVGSADPGESSGCDAASVDGMNNSSSSENGSGDEAPPPAAVASASASHVPKGARQIYEDGRWWAELYPGGVFTGLSLTCSRCEYSKNLAYVKSGMSRQEAKGRLLRWEAACLGEGQREEHKALGGRLLIEFA